MAEYEFMINPAELQEGFAVYFTEMERCEKTHCYWALLALAAEKDVPQHAEHDPFHFDYVDSDEPNALALCGDGHSFIGVTIPLLDRLWQSASSVAESADVATLLDMRLSDANEHQ